MEFLTLSVKGVILAFVFAAAFILLGFGLGPFFLIAMIVFLVLSAIVTHLGLRYKKGLGVGQEPRGIWNVIANGLPPLIMAFLFWLSMIWHNNWLALLAVIGFLASVAAITADKFSSEVGVLDGRPKMIFTLKEVKKGTSGGITEVGLLAGLFAAFLIALLIFLIPGNLAVLTGSYGFSLKKALLAITAAGFVGTIVDSMLGYYEERGIGNKFTSNFICGIVGGLVAMALFALL